MRAISYAQIQALHAAARRERSYHVYCLLVRARQWLISLLPNGTQQSGPCCAPA